MNYCTEEAGSQINLYKKTVIVKIDIEVFFGSISGFMFQRFYSNIGRRVDANGKTMAQTTQTKGGQSRYEDVPLRKPRNEEKGSEDNGDNDNSAGVKTKAAP